MTAHRDEWWQSNLAQIHRLAASTRGPTIVDGVAITPVDRVPYGISDDAPLEITRLHLSGHGWDGWRDSWREAHRLARHLARRERYEQALMQREISARTCP